MPTTTIRLPEALKARVATAAKRAGKSVHSYLLDAIADKTAQDERRTDFDQEAEARYSNLASSGNGIGWDDMRRYLRDRAQGKKATPPVARKLTRR